MEKYVKIAHEARVGFEIFMNLESLDDYTKQSLHGRVRRYQIHWASLNYKLKHADTSIIRGAAYLMIILLAIIPIIVSNWLGSSYPLRQWLLIYLVYILAWLLSFLILAAPIILFIIDEIVYVKGME